MHKENFITCREYKIDGSSFINDADDHELLGVNQEQAPEAQASAHPARSSIVMP